MNKKLIITETQYKRLLNLLVEATFYDMTKNAKPGDMLSIQAGGQKQDFKVLNNKQGMLQMDATKPDASKIIYRYLVNPKSLNNGGNTLQTRRIDRVKGQKLINDPLQWPKFEINNVEDIQISRNGEVIDTLDAHSPEQQQQQTAQQAAQQAAQQGGQQGGQQSGQQPAKQGVSGDTETGDSESGATQSYDAEEIYKMILADKDMQKVFYRQPGFWDLFVAELKGGKAKGKGLITVLDALGGLNKKRQAKTIGPGFKSSGQVLFEPLEPISIVYTDPNGVQKTYNEPKVEQGKPNYIYNKRFSVGVEKELIKRIKGLEGYRLQMSVKAPTSDPNVKLCDVSIVKETTKGKYDPMSKEYEYEIRFLQSDGYTKQATNTEPEKLLQPQPKK